MRQDGLPMLAIGRKINLYEYRCSGGLLTTEKAIDEPDRLIREWAL